MTEVRIGKANANGMLWAKASDGTPYTTTANRSLVIEQSKTYYNGQQQGGAGGVAIIPDNLYADTSDTAQLRVMIQLATGATDEALETCTNVLAMMANADFVIEKQNPTADNNYTWYRKYKSGWVEQGGSIDSVASGTYTVTFPVEMADTHYTILKTMSTTSSNNAQYHQVSFANKTTTSAQTNTAGVGFSWQVSGMAQA
jgi:hypothetical protein